MQHRGMQIKCWMTKPMEMLEHTAFGSKAGLLSLTFSSMTLTSKAMGIASRRKFWRARHEGRRICMRRHALNGIETSPPLFIQSMVMANKHAHATERHIAGMLAAKWTWQYSQMACFIRTRMCLAVV
jgi:hypothetical protein